MLSRLHRMTWNFLKGKEARNDFCVQGVTNVRSEQRVRSVGDCLMCDPEHQKAE